MNRLLNFNLLNKLKYKKNKCQINHCKFLYLIYIYNLLFNNYSLQINCRTWVKDTHELIDYDSHDIITSNLEINSPGYILRSSNNSIIFSSEQKDNDLLLEVKKDINSNYQIITNVCQLDENKNIQTNNNCWFIFRKSIQGQNFKYKIKEGDIIRFGRITTRIKEIVFNKSVNKKNKINIINNTIKENEDVRNEIPVAKSGEITNRKGGVSKINSLKLSSDVKKINILKLNLEKKEEENNKEKEKIIERNPHLKITQTIPINLMQRSNKKPKLPKLCKICYGEEEDPILNPLVQPCHCSGSLKYIHLECLKHWLNTKSCIKIEDNERFCVFLVKQIECEICKEKFPDFVKHRDQLYEILEPNVDFDSYCILEILTIDKEGKRYIYVINLEKNSKLKIGRGHDAHLTLGDISVSRVHGILTIENKKIFLEDNNSKFGTLCLVQNPVIKLIEDLPLHVQVGRTYLDCKIKRAFSFFLCCGVSEKPDINYYFQQNEEEKQPNLMNMFTIKSEIDYSEDYEINEKDKMAVYEEEKNNDNVNEVKTFYENDFFSGNNNNRKARIKFSKEDTLAENRISLNNEEEKKFENKDNNEENNDNNNLQDKINEIESIVLESESDNHSS